MIGNFFYFQPFEWGLSRWWDMHHFDYPWFTHGVLIAIALLATLTLSPVKQSLAKPLQRCSSVLPLQQSAIYISCGWKGARRAISNEITCSKIVGGSASGQKA